MSYKEMHGRIFLLTFVTLVTCGACTFFSPPSPQNPSEGSYAPKDASLLPSPSNKKPQADTTTTPLPDHYGDNDQVEISYGCSINSLFLEFQPDRTEKDAVYYTFTISNKSEKCEVKTLKIFPVDAQGVRLNHSLSTTEPVAPTVLEHGKTYTSSIRFEKDSFAEECLKDRTERPEQSGRKLEHLEVIINDDIKLYTPSRESVSACLINRVGSPSMTPLQEYPPQG